MNNPDSMELATETSTAHAFARLMRFCYALRMRKGVVIACLLVSGLLCGTYYVTQPPVYESQAELLVLQIEQSLLDGPDGNTHRVHDAMPTYQKLLMSDNVLDVALNQLPREHLIDFEGVSRDQWMKKLRAKMRVHSTRGTDLIEVSYRSYDPQTAATVVSTVLTAYLDYLDTMHRSDSNDLLEILTTEKNTLQQQLEQKEAELIQMRGQTESFIGGGGDDDHGVNVIVARVQRLNEDLVEAQKETLESRSILQAVEQALHNGEDMQQYALLLFKDVGEQFLMKEYGLGNNDGLVAARMQQELIDNQAELRNKLQHYGPSHPYVMELNEKIRITEAHLNNWQYQMSTKMRQIRNEELGPRLLQMARQKLTTAIGHEQSIFEQFQRDKKAALELNHNMAKIEMLNLDLKRLRSLHDLLLTRIKDIDLGQQSGVRTSIVSDPKVMPEPVAPRLSTAIFLALFLGLGSGIGLVYALDALDDRFRTPEELRNQLGTQVLAMVPRMEQTGGAGIDSVHTAARPNGTESEAFRTLRTSLTFSGSETQRMVFSSTEPSDGKTTTIANLAVAFAQSGKRTLLIDSDMRRPGLTAMLELKGVNGLSRILREDTPMEQSVAQNIHTEVYPGLDVIPSGTRPANPAELLSGDRLPELLAWAETVYDQILIDAPPVLAVSDATLVGRYVDGIALVIRPDKNRRRLVIRAFEAFTLAGINVLGVVVNALSRSQGDYYGYGYGYGYGYDYGNHSDDEQQHGQLTLGEETHNWETPEDDEFDYPDDSDSYLGRAA